MRSRWRRSAVCGALLLVAGAAGPAHADPRAGLLTGLPLVEHVPRHRRPNVCVIFFSGDGGWADLDATVTRGLLLDGTPVIGVDSLRWFLLGRSPGHSTRDLLRLMMFYRRVLATDRFVLAGYSRGADTLPFMVRRLPPQARAWVRLLALLAPARQADFQSVLIHNLRGGPPAWALKPVAPELDALRGLPCVGYYGTDEAAASLCTQVPQDFTAVVPLPGGHHFAGNARHHGPYQAIADDLRARITDVLAR